MQTVDKAFTLLKLFSITQPEIGLSELARLAKFDKAATRRFLVALQNHQFIEQNPDTKAYRLGTGFLSFARIREEMFPIQDIVQQSLGRLTQITSETSHGSIISGEVLTSVAIHLSERSNRVHINASEKLPLNATASGLAYLAFAPDMPLMMQAANLPSFTDKTITDPGQLMQSISEVKEKGYSVVRGGFEDDVTGIAVPIFSRHGFAMGALAVATPSSRMNDEHTQNICLALLTETAEVTKALGGMIPPRYQHLINVAWQDEN